MGKEDNLRLRLHSLILLRAKAKETSYLESLRELNWELEERAHQNYIEQPKKRDKEYINKFPKAFLSNKEQNLDELYETFKKFSGKEKSRADMMHAIIEIVTKYPSRRAMINEWNRRHSTAEQEEENIVSSLITVEDVKDDIIIAQQDNEIDDLIKLAENDEELMNFILENTREDGLMNLDAIMTKTESDLVNIDGFPFYLSKEEITSLSGILSDNEKRRQIIEIIDQTMQSDDKEMVNNMDHIQEGNNPFLETDSTQYHQENGQTKKPELNLKEEVRKFFRVENRVKAKREQEKK